MRPDDDIGVRPYDLIVSIHAPAGGATATFIQAQGGEAEFQSTHPQGVRHLLETAGQTSNNVSIHAPAGGATRNFKYF